jgi:hypothetical protein
VIVSPEVAVCLKQTTYRILGLRVAQVVECLPSMLEALGSILSAKINRETTTTTTSNNNNNNNKTPKK